MSDSLHQYVDNFKIIEENGLIRKNDQNPLNIFLNFEKLSKTQKKLIKSLKKKILTQIKLDQSDLNRLYNMNLIEELNDIEKIMLYINECFEEKKEERDILFRNIQVDFEKNHLKISEILKKC